MIKTSLVANNIKLSLVRSLFNEAKKYDDVIDFTLGDPDVQPHQAIKDAACAAIQAGNTRYSQNAGLLELRQSISKYYERKEGFCYDPVREVMVTVGAMEGLYLTLISMLNPGDEVIIPAPYYVNYAQMIRMCHAKPVIIDNPERTDLSFDVTDIERAITPKTRAIMINTPSNPSGRIIPWKKIEDIAELAKKYDLVVISDEVYKCLIYDNVPFKSIVALDGMRERTILINSLSKEFCMTGYRIGYVLAPEEIIAAMTKLQENVCACAPLPSQYAAIKALSGEEDYSKNMVEIFTERRNALFEGLSKIDKFDVKAPEATFYMMVDISKTGMGSIDFCYALLRGAHVAAVPGVTYGQCCNHYIRIAFTLDIVKIKEGVRRIKEFMLSIPTK